MGRENVARPSEKRENLEKWAKYFYWRGKYLIMQNFV